MNDISTRATFNRAQAAAYCGCAVQQLDKWLSRPQNPLPCIRMQRRIIILKDSLSEWLHAEERRQAGGVYDE